MDGYGKRVLVVDDDDHTRAFIGILLQQAGYNVVQACDGLNALEEIKKRRFDVVVTDWVMPVLDGLELLYRIQEISPQLPVILVSGNAPDCMEAANASPWFAFLWKPFDNSIFLELVRAAAQASMEAPLTSLSLTQRGRARP